MPEVRAQIIISARDEASKSLKGIAAAGGDIKKGLAGALTSLTGVSVASIGVAGAITGVALALKYSVEQAAEHERVFAQVAAVIKSTGGAAGLTSDAIDKMSVRLSRLNAIDDETIAGGAATLLTFTHIRKEAFEPTLQAALDMSTALKIDLKGALIQVGKALESPTLGMTALRRSGVSFSAEQTEVIKKLEQTGHLAEAQKLILQELNKEFGGSGPAAAKTFSGQLDLLKISLGNLGEAVSTGLLPPLTQGAGTTATWIETLTRMGGAVGDGTISLFDFAKASWEVTHTGKTMGDVLAELDAKTQDMTASNDAATLRWQGLAGTFTETLAPATNTTISDFERLQGQAELAAQSEATLRSRTDELTTAANTLTLGMQAYTEQLLFQIASQNLDADAALALADQMGLIDHTVLIAADSVAALTAKYDLNEDGALTAAEAARGYNTDVTNLKAAIDALQNRNVTITVTTIRQELYQQSEVAAGNYDVLQNMPGNSTNTGNNFSAPAPSTSFTRNLTGGGGGATDSVLLALPGQIARAVRDGLQGARL